MDNNFVKESAYHPGLNETTEGIYIYSFPDSVLRKFQSYSLNYQGDHVKIFQSFYRTLSSETKNQIEIRDLENVAVKYYNPDDPAVIQRLRLNKVI